MTTPRPDQHHLARHAGSAGSRSGSGDSAASLGFPGVPPAVPNCLSAQALRRGVGGGGIFATLVAPSRIWMVLLSYAVNSFGSFAPPSFFAATITTNLLTVPLAVVELTLAANPAGAWDSKAVPYNGLPVVAGDGLALNINGGNAVPGVNQEASAVVLYSTP